MLDRQHGCLVIECDSCGDLYEGDGAEDASPAFFDAFIAGAKQEGWKMQPVGNDWAQLSGLPGGSACGMNDVNVVLVLGLLIAAIGQHLASGTSQSAEPDRGAGPTFGAGSVLTACVPCAGVI